MSRNRMEAFSDGVIAIIITIMVLELRAPHDPHLSALKPMLPVFLSYAMSFIFIGIYWSNHHHLLHAVEHVDGGVLWANLHLLFWLSLTPFATAWVGESRFAPQPVAVYGVVLLLSGVSYYILTRVLLSIHPEDSVLANALGRDFKGKISMVIYLIAIPLAFVRGWLAYAIYMFVAVMWLVPDRRIERTLAP
jgi:uncharacterized membrane protein